MEDLVQERIVELIELITNKELELANLKGQYHGLQHVRLKYHESRTQKDGERTEREFKETDKDSVG